MIFSVFLSLLIVKLHAAEQDCCDPCADCLLEVDTLQNHNNIYAPITIGSGVFNYTAAPFGMASSTGQDGWFNSTTAAPYSITSNEQYELIRGCNEFVAEAVLTFSSQLVVGSVTSPFGFNQDPMYGAGFFGVVSREEGWTFQFLLTNSRVYAMIQRSAAMPPSITNNAEYFTYIIPVACRRPKDINQYRIILKASDQALWFQIDGKDVLSLCHPGRPPIDRRFLVSETGGYTYQSGFPTVVRIALGFTVIPRGFPNAVCQQTIFNQSEDNLFSAKGVCCQYAPWQDPSEYLIAMKMRYYELQVLQAFCGRTCPTACCPDCHESPNPCRIPMPESSSCEACSSSYESRRSSSSSSLSSCGRGVQVRTPSESHQYSCGSRCMPHPHVEFPLYNVEDNHYGRGHLKPASMAVWLGNHAAAARRRARRPDQGCCGRVVSRNLHW